MNRVFIVHGHDHKLRNEVRDYIKLLGLEPIVLSDQPNQGNTLIEKFEQYAGESNYAITLLTGDDVGAAGDAVVHAKTAHPIYVDHGHGTMGDDIRAIIRAFKGATRELTSAADMTLKAQLKPRARQNVILELGFFIGKLSRRHVCVLAPKDVELPSDMLGIVVISTGADWKAHLLQELQAAKML